MATDRRQRKEKPAAPQKRPWRYKKSTRIIAAVSAVLMIVVGTVGIFAGAFVLDKLNKAKAVDPSVAKEVQKMYSAYSTHTPKIEDLFFLGYSKGQAITIGGWINERTTIR